MIDLNKKQIELAKKYIKNYDLLVKDKRWDELLDLIEDAITFYGTDDDYELTKEGLDLRAIYDEIYYSLGVNNE